MADIPFRILLDVSDLRETNYKLIWINIFPKEIITIENLKKHVMQKIEVALDSAKFYLGEGLLLENETIMVLREGDTIRVILDEPSSEEKPKSNKKVGKSSKRSLSMPTNSEVCSTSTKNKRCQTNNGICHEEENVSKNDDIMDETNYVEKKSNKRHKKNIIPGSHHDALDKNQSSISISESFPGNANSVSCSTPFNTTQKNLSDVTKKFFDADCTDCNNSVFLKHGDSLYSFKCNLHALSQNSNTSQINNINSSSDKSIISMKANASNMSQKSSCHITTESNVELTNSVPKKRRKRHRKRKRISSPNSMSVECVTLENNNTNFNVNDVEMRDVKRKHTIYSSPHSHVQSAKISEIVSLDSCDDDCDMIYESSNTNVTKQKNVGSHTRSTSKSNSHTSSNWDVSVTQNACLKYTEENGCQIIYPIEGEKKEALTEESEIASGESHERNYDILPPLKCQPKLGAHIAYKVLELDEFYSPVVSEYREGIVKRIDPSSDEIEIELLKHLIKPGRVGKFENLKDDEPPPPEIKKQDIINWTALVEPKLISSSS